MNKVMLASGKVKAIQGYVANGIVGNHQSVYTGNCIHKDKHHAVTIKASSIVASWMIRRGSQQGKEPRRAPLLFLAAI